MWMLLLQTPVADSGLRVLILMLAVKSMPEGIAKVPMIVTSAA